MKPNKRIRKKVVGQYMRMLDAPTKHRYVLSNGETIEIYFRWTSFPVRKPDFINAVYHDARRALRKRK